jgi:hypothetical protein
VIALIVFGTFVYSAGCTGNADRKVVRDRCVPTEAIVTLVRYVRVSFASDSG